VLAQARAGQQVQRQRLRQRCCVLLDDLRHRLVIVARRSVEAQHQLAVGALLVNQRCDAARRHRLRAASQGVVRAGRSAAARASTTRKQSGSRSLRAHASAFNSRCFCRWDTMSARTRRDGAHASEGGPDSHGLRLPNDATMHAAGGRDGL
jgi:hypothetical protein